MGNVGTGQNKVINETAVTAIVPGVTTLFGEFSYYCQGNVICCANDRVLRVTVAPSPDAQVHVHNCLTNDHKRFSPSSLKFRKEDKWANYIKGIYLQLADIGIPPRRLEFTLDGPVLKDEGAVLASAICVGAVLAMKRLVGFVVDTDRVAMMCYMCCTGFCGELTKYSTVTAMLRAEEGKFILFDLNTLTYRYLDNPFTDGCTMLSIDCRTPPLAIREEILHTHTRVKNSFLRLRAVAPNHSIRDYPLADLRERVLPLDEECRRACYTVIEDSNAAAVMRRYFPDRSFALIGRTLTHTGKLIRDGLDLTCPEIDWLIKRATEDPLCNGAGILFNGDSLYVGVVLDDRMIARYNEKLEDYERIFGFKARVRAFRPCGPVKLE